MESGSGARRPRAGRLGRSGQAWPALYVLAFFFGVGAALWLVDGQVPHLVFFGLIGLSVGGGFLIHARARPQRKPLGRKLSLALVGLSLLLGAGVLGRQSFQIEGFFFYVLAGVMGGVVTHYLVAKIAGPLLIGRAWCGWGCWIWMLFDYLPYKRSPGPREGWPLLRIAHFVLSLGLVALLALGLGYDHGFEWKRTDGLWWFLGGAGAYYVIGVSLALLLKDNRAFCKYVCPITVFLRAGSRLALLKVKGSPEGCRQCQACETVCPMDVPVSAFVAAGTRVLDAECTLCQRCVGACPESNLGLSLGLDFARGRRPQRQNPTAASAATRAASRPLQQSTPQ